MDIDTRGRLSEEELSSLADDRASRADVLLHLGEPECVLEDERVLVYVWLLSVGWSSSNIATDIPSYHFAFLVFDEDGRLSRCDLPDVGFLRSPGGVIDRWLEKNGRRPGSR